MLKFTNENTTGFNQQELDVLNAANRMIIEAAGTDHLPDDLNEQFKHNVFDMINNAWFRGATADDLASAVLRRLQPKK